MATISRAKLEKERDRVFDALEDSARMVGQRDAYILESDLREEAIIHRLAYYLEANLLADKVLNLENFSVVSAPQNLYWARHGFDPSRNSYGVQRQLRKLLNPTCIRLPGIDLPSPHRRNRIAAPV